MLETLVQLQKKKICVVGDFMLDSYTKGHVKRISPEAPVCVLGVKTQTYMPGGAGNVALNCMALGCLVEVIGRVGDDFASERCKQALSALGVNTQGFFYEEGYETPLKNRVMADHQQLLRIDFEKDHPLEEATFKQVVAHLEASINQYDLVLISDYNKGFLTRPLLKAVIQLAIAAGVPVFVDPKGYDFSKYEGATLIKPNLLEAYRAAGCEDKASLDEVAAKLLHISKAPYLLITRSEQGMSLFSQEGLRVDVAASVKEVIDVTGAGDTVIATLAVSVASGLDIQTGIRLASIAASSAIEKAGCVHVGKKELIKAMARQNACFKYIGHDQKDMLSLLFAGETIAAFHMDPREVDFELLRRLSHLKKTFPDRVIAIIIPEDVSKEVIYSLCELSSIDLVMPASLEWVMQELYVIHEASLSSS